MERMEPPKTQYARSGDVHIAYQVVGDGPIDLVLTPGSISHLDLAWEEPHFVRAYERLASFSRLILFDKRGTGLSDRVAGIATLEERMDDIRAVMDAAGSERAALIGTSEGGPMSILFAATYPERTRVLVLNGSIVTGRGDDEFPWHFRGTEEELRELLDAFEFDEERALAAFAVGAPSAANDERAKQWWLRLQRSGASPGAQRALAEMNSRIDVRGVLSAIRVPTLVIHASGDRWVPIAEGRYIADHIPGARFVELPSDDHITSFGDFDAFAAEVQEFVTGVRPAPEPDRVLATVLFTDIVGSTDQAAKMGDHRWRDLLDEHDGVVRRHIDRFRGKEINTVGDGFLATFDGPARAIRCAQAIADDVGPLGVAVRAGLHTGEIEFRGKDVSGIAVHIGQRVSALAGPGEVLVSRTVTDLVAGSGLEFDERGEHDLKGVPGRWQLFAVQSSSDAVKP